jgi:hypothetical protein
MDISCPASELVVQPIPIPQLRTAEVLTSSQLLHLNVSGSPTPAKLKPARFQRQDPDHQLLRPAVPTKTRSQSSRQQRPRAPQLPPSSSGQIAPGPSREPQGRAGVFQRAWPKPPLELPRNTGPSWGPRGGQKPTSLPLERTPLGRATALNPKWVPSQQLARQPAPQRHLAPGHPRVTQASLGRPEASVGRVEASVGRPQASFGRPASAPRPANRTGGLPPVGGVGTFGRTVRRWPNRRTDYGPAPRARVRAAPTLAGVEFEQNPGPGPWSSYGGVLLACTAKIAMPISFMSRQAVLVCCVKRGLHIVCPY